MRRAEAAGFKTVPTGAEHGTITVVAGGKPYEVTTLRADVETDGRRAKVLFGRDWKRDAERRDFTINALYATADGEVVDLVGGIADIESRAVRFIGDAETRIREDYLRILRFFRFFAWYGAGRPDAEGLKACARLKDGLDRLSAERVWSELKKLLSAPDPSRALLWMRQAGVLTQRSAGKREMGHRFHPPAGQGRERPRLAGRSAAQAGSDGAAGRRAHVVACGAPEAFQRRGRAAVPWALAAPIEPTTTEGQLAKELYRHDRQGSLDRLRLALAAARGKVAADDKAMMEAGSLLRLLAFAEKWENPIFPVDGGDLTQLGFPAGPKLGAALKTLEDEWIASGFALDRDALLERAAASMED